MRILVRNILTVLLFIWMTGLCHAQIPRSVVYQGRLLDHSTLKPIPGNFTRDFLVLIRRVSDPNQASQPLLSRQIDDVVINDGLFTLTIDVSSVGNEPILTFDEPYFLEVVMGNQATGGKVGQQVFLSYPFAFAAENVLFLDGLPPSSFALNSHGHSFPGTSTFTVDGSNQPRQSADQFIIRNDNGVVFAVDEDATLKSVRNIQATSDIITNDYFMVERLVNNADSQIIKITQSGDFMATHELHTGKVSVAGHLKVTGRLSTFESSGLQSPNTDTFTFGEELKVVDSFRFAEGSLLINQGTTNVVGIAHTLEDHIVTETSILKSALETLVSGVRIGESFHRHSYTNKEVSEFPNDSIKSELIVNGQLTNEKFQSADAQNLIEDTKLATISTPGKISLSAVPSEVALKTVDGDFTNPFPLTRTDFDQFKSKALTITSSVDDRIDGAFPLLLVSDLSIGQNNAFKMVFKSNGDMTYSREITPISSFGFESPGDRSITKFIGNQVRFEDLGGNSSVSFFNGSVIANGSITGIDLSAGLVDNSKLKTFQVGQLDSGLQEADFDTEVVLNAKLAGNLTEVSIGDLAVTSDKISGTAINIGDLNEDDFLDLTLRAEDFANDTFTSSQFASLTITDGKFAGATLEHEDFCFVNSVNDKSCLDSETLTSGVFADDAFTSIKITTDTNLIINDKFSAEVFLSRTQPMKVSTDAMNITTLKADNYMAFVRMTLTNFGTENDFKSGVEIATTTGRRIISLNNNGTLSLTFEESANRMNDVTLAPPFLATLFRVEDSQSNCGNGDSNMIAMSGITDKRSDCISKSSNHGSVQLPFRAAMHVCQSHGYQLCDMSQYYQACTKGILSNGESSLGRQMLTSTLASVFQVDTGDNCADPTIDFSIGAADATTATGISKDFRCCLKY